MSQTTAGGDAVEDRVLSLVSEKTGYPRDMLELDLDLEADLGIDTVKQAEIFGMVRESFGIPRQDTIKLREYPTIRHVIGFVHQMSGGAQKPAQAPFDSATPGGVATLRVTGDGSLFRLPVPVLRPTLDTCKPTAAKLEKGRGVVVVSDSGGAGAALAQALEGRGLRVLRIDDRPQPKELEARIAQWAKSGPVAGAYFLRALDPDRELSEMDLAAWRSLHQDGVKSLCALSRALYAALGEQGAFLLSATRLGGVHGYDAAGARFPSGGAVTGFTKALARERTLALVKAVDFEEGAKAEAIAQALLAETERDPGAVEIGYRDGLRFGIAALSEEPAATAEPLPLGSDTVFLVAGGAGGITAAIVKDLAAASKGTFHLLGTRPMPDEATRQMVAKLANREALQRELFAALKAEGARATPAAVEKRVFELERSASILETVRGIEQAGGKAHYHAVDIVREDAVQELVKGIGRVDVLVHAAGLERSRSLETKPVEEFDRIFEVKADGLFNLLRATSGSQLKAFVGFSSVAGRFGNAGQTDYSAGNDLLCKVASRWAAQQPGRLAFVADWSAWGEIGMAARGNIPELMKRAGIELLSPAEGVPVVRQMLARGFSGEAVVGRGLGGLFAPLDPDGGLDPKAFAEAANQRQTALAIASPHLDLHRGLEVSLTLDPKREPFLYDHQIDGTPVLPGVMGLEGFAEVGTMLAPGLRVSEIRDVRFLAPLKYFRQEPRPATFRALPLWNRDGGLGVRLSLSSLQPAPGSAPVEKTHFVATLLLEKDEGKVKAPKVQPAAAANGHRLGHDDIYRVYFHGPAYQVLSEVTPTAGGVLGAMAKELPADTSDPDRHHLFAPRLVELCFQTAGVWEIGKTGRLGLPASVERVKVFGAPKKGAGLVAEVAVRNVVAATGELQFDAKVRDEKGHVYVEVQGYRTAQLPGGVSDEQLRPFKSVTAR